MTAAWMWARAELRARWRAWVLLGLLAGVTIGVAAAGWAGARRTERAVPDFVRASGVPTAAVLPNDPAFDAAKRAEVARLPGVDRTFPFLVGFSSQVFSPTRLGRESAQLFPVTAASMPILTGPLVGGRLPDPARADEVVVDENVRDRFGLTVGSTMVVGQDTPSSGDVPPEFVPSDGIRTFRQRLTVVGIAKSVSSEPVWTPSSGFYREYGRFMPNLVNEMVDLRGGARAIPAFTRALERLLGHPVNVEDTNDLFGIRKARNVTDVEADGLLLFALATLLGGGVLVGQALVRAVNAGAADLPTWRAIGADRRLALRALVLPALGSAVLATLSAGFVAVLLSSRFPLATARDYDLDLGTHADWLVLGVGAAIALVGVLLVATTAAWWRLTRPERADPRPSMIDRIVAPMSGAPALMIGARLAGEPGRGRRAVPVRSALVGAIAGVLGVVACLTFQAGIRDAVAQPRRSGVVWDFTLAVGDDAFPAETVSAVGNDRDVAALVNATWHRAIPVNGRSIPVFGTRAIKGEIPFVVLEGRAPQADDEIAFAPTTLGRLGVEVGDRVRLGDEALTATVVGEALLPTTSHTDYDQSGWMTAAGTERALGRSSLESGEDYLLLRWRDGADVGAAERRLVRVSGSDVFAAPAELPVAVADLARIEDLPLALSAFFALLACATVAHALVTTVRRRRHDLAILRAVGFTRRQTRGAIAWQATLLSIAGVVIGVPLGIATGRIAWRWLADDFPIVYAPPLALLAVVVVAGLAVVIANALAAGPARSAARIRPAESLRVE